MDFVHSIHTFKGVDLSNSTIFPSEFSSELLSSLIEDWWIGLYSVSSGNMHVLSGEDRHVGWYTEQNTSHSLLHKM